MASTVTLLQPFTSTLTDTSAVIYTASTGSNTLTTSFVSNNTSAAIELNVSITRGSSTVSIITSRSIPANSTYCCTELNGLVLFSGDSISASGVGLVMVGNGYNVT